MPGERRRRSRRSPPGRRQGGSAKALRRKEFDLFTLFEIANHLTASVDPDHTLRTILLTTMAEAGSGLGGIWVADLARTKLELRMVRGMTEPMAHEVPLDEGMTRELMAHREPFSVDSFAARKGCQKVFRPMKEAGFERMVVLEWQDKLAGLIGLGGSQAPHGYDADALRIVSTLGAFAAAVLERDRLLDQIRQTEKLSALGQFIAGIAHELNNPLGAILGFSQLMAKSGGGNPDQWNKDLGMIQQQADRALHIVQELVTFARQRPLDRTAMNVNVVVESVAAVRRNQKKFEGVNLETRLDPSLPPVMADPFALEQVLVNILNNAADAVGTRADRSKPGVIVVTTRSFGRSVQVAVQDNGCGIPSHHLKKLFDPFFTTKPVGQGTGLGLAICHSLMVQHGGELWCESVEGRGTTFTVSLPFKED